MQFSNLEVRRYVAGDETRILDTFNLVFRRTCGDGFRARDLAQWRWQYEANPAGRQIFLAVDSDGTVAAQYAAVPQTVDTAFGPLRFVHVVDSMTHPDYRVGLQRTGVFATLGRAFTADYREHGNEVGYGFPVRAAERIGSRLLGYELLRSIDYLMWPCSEPAPAMSAGIEVARVQEFPREVDALWRRTLPERPCAVRRDHAYLQWRYVQHPVRRDYELLVARRADQLSGLLVLRPFHELVPHSAAIVDRVWHDDDDETARALVASACRRAAECGRRQLIGMFADTAPEWAQLQELGFVAQSSAQWLERRLTYRITGPYLTRELLRTDWRYALGDTDLA